MVLQGRWQSKRILGSPCPRIHLDNHYISVNNPENDLNWQNRFSTVKYREDTLKKVGRAEKWSRANKPKGLCGGRRDVDAEKGKE